MLTNIINFYPALNLKGCYFLEDFRHLDDFKENEVKYNLQNNRKYLAGDPLSIKGIFENINEKKIFNHKMLNKNTLEYIIKTTEKAEIIYQDHPMGAVAILQKK